MADAIVVSELAAGDHACLTFTDPDERLDLVAAFVGDGLQLGQRVICFTDTFAPDELTSELALREIPAREAIGRGQLSMRGSHESWLSGGDAIADRMLRLIADEMRHTVAEGFPGLRVTADMCWATRPVAAVDQLVAFEQGAADLFADGRLTVICQYDRDSFDAVTLAFAARSHGKAVAALAYYDTPLTRICRQHRPPGIRLAGEVDYSHLQPLQQALSEALRLDQMIHVNLNKVSFIDVTAATAIAKSALSLPSDRTMVITCPREVAAVFDAIGADQASQLRLWVHP
ncbi:MAG TPA: MEDS domain-containing protein [Candidatus Limnocylindrales bacterium]|nr:MEDS domain-containing protein [Candidatus Limnocylindrales bacterium]